MAGRQTARGRRAQLRVGGGWKVHSDCYILGEPRSQGLLSLQGCKNERRKKEDRGEASTELHKLCRSSTEASQTESAMTNQ